VEHVAGRERVDGIDREYRHGAHHPAGEVAHRPGAVADCQEPLGLRRHPHETFGEIGHAGALAQAFRREITWLEMPNSGSSGLVGRSASSTIGMPRWRAASQIGRTKSGRRLSARSSAASLTSPSGSDVRATSIRRSR
jgi:hypothetical protein